MRILKIGLAIALISTFLITIFTEGKLQIISSGISLILALLYFYFERKLKDR